MGSPWMWWLVIGGAWMVGTFGGGWVLALMFKRLHPELSFYKLWALWSSLLGGIVALVFALGLVRL
ncbi:MAG TPA: hypothetical protein VF142_24420 [Longimicrobium sp.]